MLRQTSLVVNCFLLVIILLFRSLLLLLDGFNHLVQLSRLLKYGTHVLDECWSRSAFIVLKPKLSLEVDSPRVEVAVVGDGKRMLGTTSYLRNLDVLR